MFLVHNSLQPVNLKYLLKIERKSFMSNHLIKFILEGGVEIIWPFDTDTEEEEMAYEMAIHNIKLYNGSLIMENRNITI